MDNKFNLLDSHRQRDMVAINSLMDQLLHIFGEEIIWENLHILDKTTDLYQLQQIVKRVKNITVSSNQDANNMVNEE